MLLLKKTNAFTLKPLMNQMFFDYSTTFPDYDVYWGRLVMHEVFLSFLFTVVYLVVRFEQSMRKVDRMVKGFAVCLALTVCLSMSAGSGGCLNSAIGIAQSIYMIGLENQGKST